MEACLFHPKLVTPGLLIVREKDDHYVVLVFGQRAYTIPLEDELRLLATEAGPFQGLP